MTNHTPTSPIASRPTYIRSIRIEKLFGYLSYTIPKEQPEGADVSRLLMLYGDNGSGKTTILTLLFCLLSSRGGRGEKTYIARTPFKRFEVFFDDGSSVYAEKPDDQPIGSYTIGLRRPGTQNLEFPLKVNNENAIQPSQNPIPELLSALSSIGVAIYFLPDDRRVRTTSATPSEEDEAAPEPDVRWLVESQDRIAARLRQASEGERSHHLDIAPVLAELNGWFRAHALQGSSTGEENATSIYLRVIEQVVRFAGTPPPSDTNFGAGLADRLEKLGARVDRFSRFGLIPPFPAEKFLSAFTGANATSRATISIILEPYVDGLAARLSALEGLRHTITTYVETTNSFLTGKSVEFTLQHGAVVRAFGNAPIDPNFLSSGEKQLILLLSNTVLARESATIFLIDEPELSLNVKWQRRLVDALLRCAEGSRIQYFLASHSLELITQHKHNAVRLDSEGTPIAHA